MVVQPTQSTTLTTAELHALDDQFIRRYTLGTVTDDDIIDATTMAIDDALDAALTEELATLAVMRDFDVVGAQEVFAHLDETLFLPSLLASASNAVARPVEFAAEGDPPVQPNLAALYPVHMLAAILSFFQLPTNMPGAWVTITLLVHQLIGHLQLLIEGLSAVLKCPICLQVFQRPYALECGHIVCEHCLNNYFLITLDAHVALYPNYVHHHRTLLLHIFFFYNSDMTTEDRRTIRARILNTLATLVRPTYECPICRAVICRPPILVYALVDVIDIALLLGVPAPDDVYAPIQHHDWRDFFIIIG